MLAVDEGADGVLGDVGGEQEEGDRDEPLGALLGVLGESAGAGEAPDDDDRREALDRGVEAEAEQRDGAGEDRGGDRDRALGGHVGEAQPRQRLRAADQPIALGQLERGSAAAGALAGAVGRVGSSSDGVLIARPRRVGGARRGVAAGVGQRVEDDLVLAPRASEAGVAQRAQVVADEVLGAAGDPCQVADAQLPAVAQRHAISQPRRITQRLCTSGGLGRSPSRSRRWRIVSARGRSRHSRSQRSSDTRSS